MALVSQAEFARLKGVSRQAVTDWKKEGRLVIFEGKIDVEATEAKIIPGSRDHTKRRTPARQVDGPEPQVDGPSRQVGAQERQVDAPPIARGFGDPPSPALGPWIAPTVILSGSGLPNEAELWCTMIETGAADLAVILLRKAYPMAAVRPLVEAWVVKQRLGACEVLDAELEPPFGHATWRDHESFTRPWLEAGGDTWSDLYATANAPPG